MKTIRGLIILLGIVLGICIQQSQSVPQENSPAQGNGMTLLDQANKAFQEASYDTAIFYYREAAAFYAGKAMHSDQAFALIRAAESARVKGYMELAEELLTQVESLIHKHNLSRPLMLGDLYHLKSNILSDYGHYSEAIEIMKEAIRYKSQATPRPDSSISMSLNNIGYNFNYISHYDSAKYYYEQALALAKTKPGQQMEDIAMFMQNIGTIHVIMGNLDSALALLNASTTIRENILEPDNPDLGYSYLNLGRLYTLLGNNSKALQYNKLGEKIIVNSLGASSSALSVVYLNMGNLYKDYGDLNKAMEYHRKCIHLILESPNPGHTALFRAYNNIGMIYYRMGEFNLALEYLEKSLHPNIQPVSEVICKRNIARTYQALGRTTDAMKYMSETLRIANSKLGKKHYEVGFIYLYYGQLLQEQGMSGLALSYLDQSIENFRQNFGKHHPYLADAYTAKADFFMANQDFDQALHYFQQALIALVPEFNDTAFFNNPKLEATHMMPNIVAPLMGKASAFRGLYLQGGDVKYLQASLFMLDDAISVVDLVRNQLTDQGKMIYSGKVREMYYSGVTTAYELYAITQDPAFLEKAFLITEKSKYAALLSSMRDLSAREIGGIPDSLKQKEQEIKDKMAAYQKMIYDEQLKPEPDNQKLASWDSQLFSFKRQQEELVLLFEESYPRYHNLKYKTDVISPAEIQRTLKPHEAVIAYFVGDTALFTFYITHEAYKVAQTSLDSTIVAQINTLKLAMTPLGVSNTSPESFAEQVIAAHALFTELIQPGYDLLSGKDLLIIPDDILGYLSFDMLLTKPADAQIFDYSKLPYLLREHNISYAYLATLQFHAEKVPARKRPSTIGFAPDYVGIQDKPADDLISLRGMEKYLLPIKHAKMEMNLLASAANARIFIDNEANEEMFKRYSPGYDIIHLAMHTVIDDENPMFSKLVFTIVPDLQEDGLLNTFEIYNMNLRARMVVLSACNTGYGQLQKGEGIISLARAFMYAGVPGIVMTLWAIEDKSGYDIMTHFYKYLRKGLSRHESIRKAKLDYLKEAGKLQAHPYFWAAYVNIGDHNPVYPNNRHTTRVAVVCLLALLLIAGGILRGRRRGDLYNFFKFDRIKSIFGL